MANEIQKQERPIDLFKSVINAPSVQAQFNNALGEHKDAFVTPHVGVWIETLHLIVASDKAIRYALDV